MRRLAIALLLLGTLGRWASAESPWSEGVSEADRNEALRLFGEGNRFNDDGLFADAATFYEEALGHWDHPAIRGNLATCQVKLGQWMKAYENLDRALRFGSMPFEPAVFRQLQQNQALVRQQLVEIEVVVDQPDTRVELDGNVLVQGPGKQRLTLPPGQYRLTAVRDGYVPRDESLSLLPARRYQAPIELMSVADATTVERHWAPWVPWAVVGAGAAVALLGVPLELQARADFTSYENGIDDYCPLSGCAPADTPVPTLFDERKQRGERLTLAASSLFVAGGAIAVTGAVMAVLNRKRISVRTTYEDPLPLHVEVAPTDGRVSLLSTHSF